LNPGSPEYLVSAQKEETQTPFPQRVRLT
jgi:hypothetical protein